MSDLLCAVLFAVALIAVGVAIGAYASRPMPPGLIMRSHSRRDELPSQSLRGNTTSSSRLR